MSLKREPLYKIREGVFKRASELSVDEEREIGKTIFDVDEVIVKEDPETKTEIWETERGLLVQLARNMDKTLNLDDDAEIEKFVEEFGKLSWEKRILYGVWGSETLEYKAQQLLKQGLSFNEVRKKLGL